MRDLMRLEEIARISRRLIPRLEEATRRLDRANQMSAEGYSDKEVAKEARPLVDVVRTVDFDRLIQLLEEDRATWSEGSTK